MLILHTTLLTIDLIIVTFNFVLGFCFAPTVSTEGNKRTQLW